MKMTEISYNWSLETFPMKTRTCLCCGKPFQLVTGMVYDREGKDLAMYVANLTEHSRDKRVTLHLGLLAKDRKGKELEKNFVSLVLWVHEGKVATSVVTDPHDPLGRLMTREEALNSPFISLFFDIDDFILEKDPYIGPFLKGKPTPDASGETQE
jgi:hypothetical protein